MPSRSKDRVIDDAATALRRYFAEGGHNADLLREASAAIVELRARFTRDKDGIPDWGGRTSGYRNAIREVFQKAGMSSQEVTTFRNRSIYHVRKALEDRAPHDELVAVGFADEPPKERQTRERAANAAIAAAFGAETTAANRVVFAERLLAQAAAEEIAALTKKQRAVVVIALGKIAAHAETLLGAVAAADAAG